MDSFFLVFANNRARPLVHLKAETDAVCRYAWKKARDRNFLPYYEPFATVTRINEMMQDCAKTISVFLYSGHASGSAVLLEDEPADLTGIAMSLRSSVESRALKVVILNGCATKDAVRTFLDIGAPVVIATRCKVGDKAASEFSRTFFKSMCEGEKSIMDSFNDGLTAAQFSNNDQMDLRGKSVRSIDYLEMLNDDTPIWEIFAQDTYSTRVRPVPQRDEAYFKFRSNEKLLKTIYTSFLNAGNKRVMELWRAEQENKIEPDLSQVESAITNSIPRPIGFQLEQLLRHSIFQRADNRQQRKRLELLNQVFRVTNEFFGIVMIAQLWEVILFSKQSIITIGLPKSLKEDLAAYFELASHERNNFNYTELVISILSCLEKMESENAVIGTFLQKQTVYQDFKSIDVEEYRKASEDHIKLMSALNRGERIEDEHQLTDICEDSLCDLFGMFSFIHRYRLNSIKIIEAKRNRHEDIAEFIHNVYSLNLAHHDQSGEIKNINCMTSHGISIVLDGTNSGNVDYLSLSPFIIDHNVFDKKSTKPWLMVFHEFQGGGRLVYRDVVSPSDEQNVSEVTVEHLKGKIILEFTSFGADVLGLPDIVKAS